MGVEILRNTATAMGPESRVVVCEMVVPDRVDLAGASEVYRLDMAMAAIGGKQKTVREWEALFDAAGLELVAVYPSAFSATAMLEARLKR